MGDEKTYISIHRGLRELRGMAQLLHLVARFDNDRFLAQEGFVVSLMPLSLIGLISATNPSSSLPASTHFNPAGDSQSRDT